MYRATIVCNHCNLPTKSLARHIRSGECKWNPTGAPRRGHAVAPPPQVHEPPPSLHTIPLTQENAWSFEVEQRGVEHRDGRVEESGDLDPYLIVDSAVASQPSLGERNRAIQKEEENSMARVKKDILDQIAQFDFLDERARKRCCRRVEKAPVFPALLAYTYTHIANCSEPNSEPDSHALEQFDDQIDDWQSRGQLWCLQNYKRILMTICDALNEPRNCEARCMRSLMTSSDVPPSDLHHLASVIIVTLRGTDSEQARSFYDMGDENVHEAHSLIDLLHYLLEKEWCKTHHRRIIWDALIRLSKTHGYYPDELYLRNVKVHAGDALGRGGFGEVRIGELQGQPVAVKLLKRNDIPERSFLKMAYNEIILWRQLRHRNILPFYGVWKDSDQISLVSPLMRNGSLTRYLRAEPRANRLQLILDVVCGLEYLHTMKPTIVHGDLKGENILVTGSGRACLADFGLAASKDSQNFLQTMRERHSGTLYYMAPELLLSTYAGRSMDYRCSDIYAFACVCFEMFTGRPPFKGYTMAQIIHAIGRKQREKKPQITENDSVIMSGSLWQFIERCWSQEPEDRLTATAARQYVELVNRRSYSETGIFAENAGDCEDEEWMQVSASRTFNPLRLDLTG